MQARKCVCHFLMASPPATGILGVSEAVAPQTTRTRDVQEADVMTCEILKVKDVKEAEVLSRS